MTSPEARSTARARRPAVGPGDDDAQDGTFADGVFEALADATRRAVLRTVATEGPLTATELAGRFPVSRQAVAKHLETLRAAGLVTRERSGRDVRFSFQAEPLDAAVDWITRVGSQWDRRLAALRTRAEGSGGAGARGPVRPS